MINRLILFLIRYKFGLKKFEGFRFTNQKTKDIYYFGNTVLFKDTEGALTELSHVSLNWLLNDDCKIIKIE
jgi:hypothetical protein